MYRSLVLVGLVVCGGCARELPSPRADALSASAAAQQFGIGSYVVGGDGRVDVLDREGRSIGLLWVTSQDRQRDVAITFFDDSASYRNEVTDPVDGRFIAPIVDEDRGGAVQADQALAAYFARFDLRFVNAQAVGPAKPELQPQVYGDCAIPFVSSCTPLGCYLPQYFVVAQGYICDGSLTGDDDAVCNQRCKALGYGRGSFTSEISDCDGGSGCGCDTAASIIHRYAKCPTNVGCSGGDIVSKKRTCLTTGSCSNQALGFQCCFSATNTLPASYGSFVSTRYYDYYSNTYDFHESCNYPPPPVSDGGPPSIPNYSLSY